MIKDLQKEMHSFLEDMKNNIKDKEDLIYITQRTSKLFDVVIEEMNNILDYESDKIKALLRRQEEGDKRMQELKERIDNIYEDIYEDDDFTIECPYCNNEFEADVDEFCSDVRCPECGNVIELDWNGNPSDENQHDCGGNCSGCDGCQE